MAVASYEGLVNMGYCTWAGAYRVGHTRDGHTTCMQCIGILERDHAAPALAALRGARYNVSRRDWVGRA